MEISKRKLESYRRAELVAQELRYQLMSASFHDEKRLVKLVLHWMRVTGKTKYERPGKSPNV